MVNAQGLESLMGIPVVLIPCLVVLRALWKSSPITSLGFDQDYGSITLGKDYTWGK
jgi:hypothetical protein